VIQQRGQVLVDDREGLEGLAEALQKFALDRALSAYGAPPKYGTAPGRASSPTGAKDWLAYARQMGFDRALARHPLNPRLFAAEMLGRMPSPAGPTDKS
jgi:hypothetical protein